MILTKPSMLQYVFLRYSQRFFVFAQLGHRAPRLRALVMLHVLYWCSFVQGSEVVQINVAADGSVPKTIDLNHTLKPRPRTLKFCPSPSLGWFFNLLFSIYSNLIIVVTRRAHNEGTSKMFPLQKLAYLLGCYWVNTITIAFPASNAIGNGNMARGPRRWIYGNCKATQRKSPFQIS